MLTGLLLIFYVILFYVICAMFSLLLYIRSESLLMAVIVFWLFFFFPFLYCKVLALSLIWYSGLALLSSLYSGNYLVENINNYTLSFFLPWKSIDGGYKEPYLFSLSLWTNYNLFSILNILGYLTCLYY